MASTTQSYHLRLASDRWRSVCRECFLTAAEADSEQGLTEGERAHVCGESLADREYRANGGAALKTPVPLKTPAAIDNAAKGPEIATISLRTKVLRYMGTLWNRRRA